jgi:hypothetical protein
MALLQRPTMRAAVLLTPILFPFAAMSQQNSTESTPSSSTAQTLERQSLLSLMLGQRHPGIPLRPPTSPGCYTFTPDATNAAAGKWEQAPCLSPEEARRVPHPLEGGSGVGLPGIQSQVLPIFSNGGRFGFNGIVGFASAGFQESSITVQLTPGTSLAGETDSINGAGNFSIQLNTNGFNSTCHSSNLLPPGATQSPCTPNDAGWVQFTYQTFGFGTSSSDVMCIWNVDLTNKYYYPPETWQNCSPVPKAEGWKSGDSVILIAFVDPATHVISLIGSFPWSPMVVTANTPDWFGLCWTAGAVENRCSWDEAVGGMLGRSGGSTANFGPKTGIQTTIVTQSPTVPYGGGSIYLNTSSGVSNAPGNWLAYTLEQNNLSMYYFALPTTVCSGTLCTFSYLATNVQPP